MRIHSVLKQNVQSHKNVNGNIKVELGRNDQLDMIQNSELSGDVKELTTEMRH